MQEMAESVVQSALGTFGTLIRYRESRNFLETFFTTLSKNLCPSLEKATNLGSESRI
jgi:hypothetical protein